MGVGARCRNSICNRWVPEPTSYSPPPTYILYAPLTQARWRGWPSGSWIYFYIFYIFLYKIYISIFVYIFLYFLYIYIYICFFPPYFSIFCISNCLTASPATVPGLGRYVGYRLLGGEGMGGSGWDHLWAKSGSDLQLNIVGCSGIRL